MTDKEFFQITKLDPAKPYPRKLVFDVNPILMMAPEKRLAALQVRLQALGYVQTAQQTNPDGTHRVVMVRAKEPPIDPRDLILRARDLIQRSETDQPEANLLLRDIERWLQL